MNDIKWLVEQLEVRLPEAASKMDEPHHLTGNHWLDVMKDQKLVTVEWLPEQGFGFYAGDAGYGEGPSEIVLSKEETLEKIVALLKS